MNSELTAEHWILHINQQVNSVSSTVVNIKPSGRTRLVLVMALPSKFLSAAFFQCSMMLLLQYGACRYSVYIYRKSF